MIFFGLGALSIFGVFALAVIRRWVPGFWIWLFVAGALIGATWEFGFTALEMAYEVRPGGLPTSDEEVFEFDGRWIVGAAVLSIFCIWDAGIFLVGPLIARRVLDTDLFSTFRWSELGILLAWGQVQSFAVEMFAISAGWWAYRPSRLNPELFPYAEASITLAPQLVWFLGYLVFYGAALRLKRWSAA